MALKHFATVLALSALALAPTQTSQASETSGSAAAPSRVQIRPLIQGLVVDPQGHFLDNVSVAAIRANDHSAASALTYASIRESGPQHGYFYLEVGSKGDFTLTLSKPGYVSRTYEVGEVGKKQVVSLGEIKLSPAAAPTSTDANVVGRSITPSQKGKVDVTVSTKKTNKPTGDVEVRDGNKVVGSDTLKAGDKGQVTVTLKKLGKGTYRLKAYFLGSKTLKKSNSGAVTLTVKQAKHRPNAW